jgi:hypothetical protein
VLKKITFFFTFFRLQTMTDGAGAGAGAAAASATAELAVVPSTHGTHGHIITMAFSPKWPAVLKALATTHGVTTYALKCDVTSPTITAIVCGLPPNVDAAVAAVTAVTDGTSAGGAGGAVIAADSLLVPVMFRKRVAGPEQRHLAEIMAAQRVILLCTAQFRLPSTRA